MNAIDDRTPDLASRLQDTIRFRKQLASQFSIAAVEGNLELLVAIFRRPDFLYGDLGKQSMRALCVSAWNKDPVSGVIGIQKGPL